MAVKEAAQRLEASLTYGGFEFPRLKIVINLAPSGIKKSGSHFDLAIAALIFLPIIELCDIIGI